MSAEKIIIWPFDPYTPSKEGDERVCEFLLNLKKHYDLDIQPVYVTSSVFAHYYEFIKPSDMEAMLSHISEDCNSYLESFVGELNYSKPIILDNPFSSKSAEVDRLLKFVEIENPNFVVMSSHGRKGWSRAFVGSFAENFLRQTDTPTFIINSQMHCKGDFTKALMPVETDDRSQGFVEHFLDQHSLRFVKSLELFHKISLRELEELTWLPTLYGSAGYDSNDIIASAKSHAEKFLKSFMNHPLGQKRLSYSISQNFDPLADEINERVIEQGKGFVVMRSQAGPVEKRVFGSFTQDVIRSCKVPVLVYPYNYKTAKEAI